VVVRARSMQGLVEGRVAVGNLMVLMRCWVEGLVFLVVMRWFLV
jgi:hypothetical protein